MRDGYVWRKPWRLKAPARDSFEGPTKAICMRVAVELTKATPEKLLKQGYRYERVTVGISRRDYSSKSYRAGNFQYGKKYWDGTIRNYEKFIAQLREAVERELPRYVKGKKLRGPSGSEHTCVSPKDRQLKLIAKGG